MVQPELNVSVFVPVADKAEKAVVFLRLNVAPLATERVEVFPELALVVVMVPVTATVPPVISNVALPLFEGAPWSVVS